MKYPITSNAPDVKSPSEIYSEYQYPFEWRRYDCLSLIEAMAEEYLPSYTPIYSRWHQLTEPEAYRTAYKEYGSLLQCHRQHLLPAGLIEASLPLIPGDLVVADTTTTLPDGSTWDGRHGRELLLFVDDSYRLWYWALSGMVYAKLERDPTTVFRFPALVRK